MKYICVSFLVLDPVTSFCLKHASERAGVSLQNIRVKAVQDLKSFVGANLEPFL